MIKVTMKTRKDRNYCMFDVPIQIYQYKIANFENIIKYKTSKSFNNIRVTYELMDS